MHGGRRGVNVGIRQDFQRWWEGWKTGVYVFQAFHACHLHRALEARR